MRGTGCPALRVCVQDRVIPAGAGNRNPTPTACSTAPGHPRGCGEQYPAALTPQSETGSSPRVRGTVPGGADTAERNRIIPAGAGNSGQHGITPRRGTGHPRGCGEQLRIYFRQYAIPGSSPRVRGTAHPGDPFARFARVIPAGAGNSGANSNILR